MGLVHNGHLDIRALLSCGRELLSLHQQDEIGRMLMMVITEILEMLKGDKNCSIKKLLLNKKKKLLLN